MFPYCKFEDLEVSPTIARHDLHCKIVNPIILVSSQELELAATRLKSFSARLPCSRQFIYNRSHKFYNKNTFNIINNNIYGLLQSLLFSNSTFINSYVPLYCLFWKWSRRIPELTSPCSVHEVMELKDFLTVHLKLQSRWWIQLKQQGKWFHGILIKICLCHWFLGEFEIFQFESVEKVW